jgi:hypothetical protein
MYREPASVHPTDSGWRAAAAATTVARARPSPELVRIEPHGAVTHGIDRGVEAAMAILVHRIGTTAIQP